jgi:PPOX class probable FMN-dependent enzyme
MTPFQDQITAREELAELYGPPSEAVVNKAIDHLDVHCREFIARSPFVLVATADASGRCDVSPKGGPPGFVGVLDEHRLLIPDAPGNRRIDSLRNVFENPQVGLLFLIPNLEETLRVNGRVAIVRDEELLADRELGGKPAKAGLGVEVEEAFLHCAKAFKRSGLWRPEKWPSLDGLARPAEIWRDHIALPGLTTEGVQEILDDDYVNNLYWRS